MRVQVAFLAALAFAGCAAFKTKFEPGNSTQFFPTKSSTFAVVPNAMFFLGYADNSHLKGFQAKDVVQLGDYYAYTKFGAITDCNSPDFNGVDGIVGFGLPVAHPVAPPPASGAGGAPAPFTLPGLPTGGGPAVLPPPLLFSLTGKFDNKEDEEKAKNSENNMIKRRAFSFLSTDTAAELQLGGYDPDSIDGHMFMTPSISVSDYVTVGLSLKYGPTELLEFTTKDPRTAYLPAIMDSGTSCLVIPDSTLNGLLKDKPFSKWKGIVNNTAWPLKKDSFFLNIAGATLEIPYDDWFLAKSNQSCVQRTPKGFAGLLVGDVLFRRYLVLFDLTHFETGTVLIGIAKQNKTYVPATHSEKVRKFHVHKRSPGKLSGDTVHPRNSAHKAIKKAVHTRNAAHAAHKQGKQVGGSAKPPPFSMHPPHAMDKIPIFNKDDTQYFINVSIGTPRQHLIVIFDTGSAVFGVFSKCDQDAPSYGECMFGGMHHGTGGALMDGIIVVLSISLGAVLIGVVVNIYIRRYHSKSEEKNRRKLRKQGKYDSGSSYTSDHLMYSTFTSAAP